MSTYNLDGRMGVDALETSHNEAKWALNDDLEFATPAGVVECVYLQATANVQKGDICTYTYGQAKPANDTDNGKPLCVAMATFTGGKYGWFAIKGTVQVREAASGSSGGKVYASSEGGKVTPSTTAGKQILNAVFAGANVVTMQHPCIQA